MTIIDGHNLLHAVYNIEHDSSCINEHRLCQVLDRYLKLSRRAGEIVFDGTGPRDKTEFENTDYIQVIFAGAGLDADTIIEEKIRVNSAPRSLTIVSSDKRLRKAARTRKATVIKSEDFWGKVIKQLAKKRPIEEPPMKRHGLSEKETEQWLDIFGIDK